MYMKSNVKMNQFRMQTNMGEIGIGELKLLAFYTS